MLEVNVIDKKEFSPPKLVKLFGSLNDVSVFTRNEQVSYKIKVTNGRTMTHTSNIIG
jgi:hypothetical protein